MYRSLDEDLRAEAPSGPGLLAALRRSAPLVLGALLLGAILAFVISSQLPKSYSANSQVLLGDANNVTVFRNLPVQNGVGRAQAAAEVMRSADVYARASSILHGTLSPTEVRKAVSILPSSDAAVVTVTATGSTARKAVDVAHAEAAAYIDVTSSRAAAQAEKAQAVLKQTRASQQAILDATTASIAARVAAATAATNSSGVTDPTLKARLLQTNLSNDSEYRQLSSRADSIRSTIGSIVTTMQQSSVDASLRAEGVDQVVDGSAPTSPTSPATKLNTALGAVVGLLLGAAWAWRRAERSSVVATEAAAAALSAPLLGRLPRRLHWSKVRGVLDFSRPNPVADDLKVAASSLLLYSERHGLTSLLITSVHPGEGKSAAALNLACAAFESGGDVLLVDGDLSSLGLSSSWAPEAQDGFAGVLAGTNSSPTFAGIDYAPGRRIPFLPVGESSGLSAPAGRVRGMPESLRSDGSPLLNIVDLPSVLTQPLALRLAAPDVGLIVVVSPGTSVEDLRKLRDRAQLADATVVGFILNERVPDRARRQTSRGAVTGHARPTPVRLIPATESSSV